LVSGSGEPGDPYDLLLNDAWAAEVADTITPTAWTAVTFTNSWVNFGAGEQDVEYRKIGDLVFVRGAMKSGTVGSASFTLPVGFRPPAIVYFAVPSNSLYGQFRISSAGAATLTSGSNVSALLDGVSFSIAP
jgi:hypothetical protein